MKTISQVELKRLKKKGKVRLKSGAKERSGSAAAVASTEKSGSKAAEQPTLISVMGRMAEILDRMDKRSETANPDRTAALRSGPEPGAAIIEPESVIDISDLGWPDISEPVIAAPDERKRVVEIEPGWTQKIARDKNGRLNRVEMNAPGTNIRHIFTPKRAKNGVIESVLMDTVGPKGRKSSNRLIVNRDSNQLISGLSLQQA
jgi:hypothetical protein